LSNNSSSSRPDFSPYFGRNIAFAARLNCPFGGVKSFLERRLAFLVTLKLNPLYVDGAYNSENVVMKNVFESFYVTALRFCKVAR
jgi:hypothetical protein